MEHNDNVRMRVTDAVAVEGYLSITGTPTVSISETISYSLVISTPGNLCSQASETFVFELIPACTIFGKMGYNTDVCNVLQCIPLCYISN